MKLKELEQSYAEFLSSIKELNSIITHGSLFSKFKKRTKKKTVAYGYIFMMNEPFVGVPVQPFLEIYLSLQNQTERPPEAYLGCLIEPIVCSPGEESVLSYYGLAPGKNILLYRSYEELQSIPRFNKKLKLLGERGTELREQRMSVHKLELETRVAYELLRLGLKNPLKVQHNNHYYYILPLSFSELAKICYIEDTLDMVRAIDNLREASVLGDCKMIAPLLESKPPLRYKPEPLFHYLRNHNFIYF